MTINTLNIGGKPVDSDRRDTYEPYQFWRHDVPGLWMLVESAKGQHLCYAPYHGDEDDLTLEERALNALEKVHGTLSGPYEAKFVEESLNGRMKAHLYQTCGSYFDVDRGKCVDYHSGRPILPRALQMFLPPESGGIMKGMCPNGGDIPEKLLKFYVRD